MLYLFTLHRPYVTRGLLTVSLNNFLIPSSCYLTRQALEESYQNFSHGAQDNSIKCHLSRSTTEFPLCFNSQIFVAKKV